MRPAAMVVQVARASVNQPTVVIAVKWIDHFMIVGEASEGDVTPTHTGKPPPIWTTAQTPGMSALQFHRRGQVLVDSAAARAHLAA